MTCQKCRHDYCWNCNEPYFPSHTRRPGAGIHSRLQQCRAGAAAGYRAAMLYVNMCHLVNWD